MGHNISGVIKAIRTLMRGDKGVNGDAQRIEQLGWMIFLKIFDDKDIEMELLDDAYISPIPTELQWRNWASDDEGMTGEDLLTFINTNLFPTLQKLALGTTNKRAILIREVFEGNNNYMKSGTIIRQVINKLNEVNFNSSEDRHMFGDIYETILKELQSAGDSGEFYTPRAITSFITDMVDPKLGEIIFDPACGTGGFLTSAIEHIRKNQVNNIDDRLTLQHSIKGVELKPLPHMLALTNLVLHDIEVPNIEYDDALSKELSSITQKDRVDVILANPPFGGNVSDGMEMNFPMTYRTKESADLFLILIIQYLKDGGRAGIVLPDGSLTGDGVKARIRQKLLEECNLHTIVRLPNSVFQPYASVATNLLFFTKGEPTKEVWYFEHRIPEGQKAYSKNKPIQIKEFDAIKEWWSDRIENEQAWKVDIDVIKNNGFNIDVINPNTKKDVFEHSDKILEQHDKLKKAILNNARNLVSALFSMDEKSKSLKSLSSNMDLFLYDTKNIKYIKRFIVECATNGRLTESWRRLQHIDSSIKNNYQTDRIEVLADNELPFDIPKNWEWCKFGNIADFSIGRTPPSKDTSYWNAGHYPWVAISDMKDYGLLKTTSKTINEKSKKEVFKCAPIPKNTLLMSFKLTVGRTSILNIDAYHNEAIISIFPHIDEMKMYLFYTLPYFSQLTEKRKAIKGNTLNKDKILKMNITLPPLEEQAVIVERIESLFALCDELEQQINASKGNTDILMQSLLNEAFEQ